MAGLASPIWARLPFIHSIASRTTAPALSVGHIGFKARPLGSPLRIRSATGLRPAIWNQQSRALILATILTRSRQLRRGTTLLDRSIVVGSVHEQFARFVNSVERDGALETSRRRHLMRDVRRGMAIVNPPLVLGVVARSPPAITATIAGPRGIGSRRGRFASCLQGADADDLNEFSVTRRRPPLISLRLGSGTRVTRGAQ